MRGRAWRIGCWSGRSMDSFVVRLVAMDSDSVVGAEGET
jgi:hypothetical protein